ncbi:MAG TPA: hypothetical protein DEP84_28530 [Chloroflexi bacterium]|nr:hypothetical protein [Chloroflexota bacterium]
MNATNSFRLFIVLSLVLALGPGSPARAQDETPRFRAQQAIVRLVPSADVDAYNARHGTRVLASIPSRHLYLLQPISPEAEMALKLRLETDPRTVWAELNFEGRAPEGRPRNFFVSVTTDPAPYIGQYAPDLLGFGPAHRRSNGAGVVVAVVDTGVDARHPALASRVLDSGWNFLEGNADTADVGNGLDDDGNGYVDEMTGHGTHVAGIIAMVAPAAKILPVKVLDSDGGGDAFFVAAGIYYAIDHGARVINLSLSSTVLSRVVEEAVAEARRAGIVVAAAAGNLDREEPKEYPAADPRTFGVAATDADDRKSDFSNYNETVTISAPGTSIFSSIPEERYASWSGTSMATPFVSGAAALLFAQHPGWSVQQIGECLTGTARDLNSLNPEYAGKLGAGRLDVADAVLCGVPPGALQADLNGDGAVGIAELQTLSSHWSATIGSVRYDRRLDLNLDGSIDLTDFAIASQEWSPP